MLPQDWPVALFMPDAFGVDFGKMGYGVLRYSTNPVTCVYDPAHAGKRVGDVLPDPGLRPETPIVGTLAEVLATGPKAVVLGIAPSGGLLPAEWRDELGRWVAAGLSVVNGLHDRLAEAYGALEEGQWIWDLRQEPEGLAPGTGRAANLKNRRVLMVGADMAIGKMTAGLELERALKALGKTTAFVATGQIGITINGAGVPLDAVRVDYASGAIEREVLRYSEREFVIVEGQGSLVHPGSTATLPLLRGSMPTDLVLCMRVGQTHLRRLPEIPIPPVNELIRIYEELATMGGAFPRARVAGIALHPGGFEPDEVNRTAQHLQGETRLPVVDPVGHGAQLLAEALLDRVME